MNTKGVVFNRCRILRDASLFKAYTAKDVHLHEHWTGKIDGYDVAVLNVNVDRSAESGPDGDVKGNSLAMCIYVARRNNKAVPALNTPGHGTSRGHVNLLSSSRQGLYTEWSVVVAPQRRLTRQQRPLARRPEAETGTLHTEIRFAQRIGEREIRIGLTVKGRHSGL